MPAPQMRREVSPTMAAIRKAIIDTSPEGAGVVCVEDAINALCSCVAYLIAGCPVDHRAGLLRFVAANLPAAVAGIIADDHDIVGTGFVVPKARH